MPELFDDVNSVSLARQLECVRREIRLRRQVYPRRIATRRMSKQLAEREILTMQAVEATLAELIVSRGDG